MKKTILALTVVLATFSSAAMADARLPGLWKSVNAENGALHGTMTFTKEGRLTLHPEGFDAMNGTWKKLPKASSLELTLNEVGTTKVDYRWIPAGKSKARQLELTYDNGNKQRFEKEVP